MSENFENTVNDEADMMKQNRGLYLPKESAFMTHFATSPNAEQRKIYEVTIWTCQDFLTGKR